MGLAAKGQVLAAQQDGRAASPCQHWWGYMRCAAPQLEGPAQRCLPALHGVPCHQATKNIPEVSCRLTHCLIPLNWQQTANSILQPLLPADLLSTPCPCSFVPLLVDVCSWLIPQLPFPAHKGSLFCHLYSHTNTSTACAVPSVLHWPALNVLRHLLPFTSPPQNPWPKAL